MNYKECKGGCRFYNGCIGNLNYVIGTAKSGVQIMDGTPIYYCNGVIKREEAIGYTFEILNTPEKQQENNEICNCDMFVLLSKGCQCGGE